MDPSRHFGGLMAPSQRPDRAGVFLQTSPQDEKRWEWANKPTDGGLGVTLKTDGEQ
jgi:hypothetical protein